MTDNIERRKAWESRQTLDTLSRAREERLARRRLKARLRTQVQKVRNHRDLATRKEARSVQLAHGFVLGTPYEDMELRCKTRPNWERVQEIIQLHEYGDTRAFAQRLEQWMQAARDADNYIGPPPPTRKEILKKLLRKRAKLDAAIEAYSERSLDRPSSDANSTIAHRRSRT